MPNIWFEINLMVGFSKVGTGCFYLKINALITGFVATSKTQPFQTGLNDYISKKKSALSAPYQPSFGRQKDFCKQLWG